MNTKPSMTLRFLEAREVFTLDEFMASVDPGVSERTRETNLRNAVKREQREYQRPLHYFFLHASRPGSREVFRERRRTATRTTASAPLQIDRPCTGHGVRGCCQTRRCLRVGRCG